MCCHDRAHAAFAYGSSYFWQWSSFNNEIRWHDLLMHSMPVCIVCMAFVMGMRQLYPGNTSFSICWRQPSRRVFVMIQHILWEVGAFMPPVPCRCHVRNEEKVLDAVHANLSTGAHQVMFEAGLTEFSLMYAAWSTVVYILCAAC